MVDVKVTMKNNDLSEREMKILEVLFLNLSAQANAQVNQNGMALNPIEKTKDEIFAFQFAWQSSILLEKYEELKEGIHRRLTVAIQMCGLSEAEITFKENAYLTT